MIVLSTHIIKRCDHNYELSSYICNPVRLALIWPDNSFEEICKWEIGVSSYLDVSCIYHLLQDDFPTLLPSQGSLTVQFSVQVKRDSFHNLSIPQYRCQQMFFVKSYRAWLHCCFTYFSLSSSFSKSSIKMFAT